MTKSYAEIEDALARGELLGAFDIATKALMDRPDEPRLFYFRALALARMGETEEALIELERSLFATADEDSLALRGRLLKDIGLIASDDKKAAIFRQASDAYLTAFKATGGYFSLINAATSMRLSGEKERAEELAEQVLADPQVRAGHTFFARASAGEAFLLLGDFERAATVMKDALELNDATLAARASTSRQFGMLARSLDSKTTLTLAETLRPPPIIFYSGHMFRPDQVIEKRIKDEVVATLDRTKSCIAFGAAAAGADILIAEAVLQRGGELNIVLPFAAVDFVRYSVRPFGEQWVSRHEAVLAAATSVQYATHSTYVGDAGQFDFGNQIAMGLACLRAQHLDTLAVQLAVQDGGNGQAVGGTASAAALWRETGRQVMTVASGVLNRTSDPVADYPISNNVRQPRSIIFGDFAGFSKIAEQNLPAFLNTVMGQMAEALATDASDILFRNTWGDSLFLIVATPRVAADLALKLTECLEAINLGQFTAADDAGMRIGLHHGPVFEALDPITEQIGYFGSEVTRAARLEPVTPVGKVYATQSFAAMLALTAEPAFRCRYVGPVPLAKDYGTLPMHLLTRNSGL